MSHPQTALARTVTLSGAVVMGLGSIVGTGVFVSLGLAADLVGPALVWALILAAGLALLNGLSSAQCAAAWPVSGGTYEYANRAVGPRAGFTAGWMFLTAKSASAATAALGFAGYVLNGLGFPPRWQVPLAASTALATTAIVVGGMRRTHRVNVAVVGTTLVGLTCLVAASGPTVIEHGADHLAPLTQTDAWSTANFFEATAWMFVAYTGYGRIATLGEEVRNPRQTIPRAIVATLAAVLVLYVAVGVSAVGVLGADTYASVTRTTAAPLQVVARTVGGAPLETLVSVAAVTAMWGVLLNLVLGLSRVALAMGRRGDLPKSLAVIDPRGHTPRAAVWAVGLLITGLTLLGDIQTTWSFSAFTVLIYYAFTHISALSMPADQRLYPRWTAVAGLCGCLGLACWVEPAIWATGLALLAAGHGLRVAVQAIGR